jgi:integrase
MSKDKRRQYGSGSVSQRKSDGRWVGALMAGWSADGKRRRLTVTAHTEAECKRKLDRLKAQTNRDGISEHASRNYTVKTWSEQWLQIVIHRVRPKTYATNVSTVKHWIVPVIGTKRLDHLNAGDLRRVVDNAREKGHLPSGIRARVVLLTMLKAAQREGIHVPANAFLSEAPTRSDSTRGPMPIEDARAVLTVAAGVEDGSRWIAALHTGARQNELLGLTWDRVDFAAGTIDISWQLQQVPYVSGRSGPLRIPDGFEYKRLYESTCLVRPKSKKGRRVIPMTATLAEALRDWYANGWRSEHNLVWPRGVNDPRGRKPHPDRQQWYDIQALAGVKRDDGEPYQLHECRHTAATIMLTNGASPEVIKEIMGHAAVLMTMTYAHVSRSLTTQAVASLSAALADDRVE